MSASRIETTPMPEPIATGRHVLFVQSSHGAHHPRHHFRLAASLAAAGYSVTMVAQPDLRPGHHGVVPVEYLPVRKRRFTRMLTGPLTMARALRSRPDAIHVVCLDLLPWAALARVFRRDLVVVYDSNEQYDLYMELKEWVPAPARPLLGHAVRRLEPWLGARLDAVTTAVPATETKFRTGGARTLLVRNFLPRALVGAGHHAGPFEYDVLVGGTLKSPQIVLLAETAARLRALMGVSTRWVVAARNFGLVEERRLLDALASRGLDRDVTVHCNLSFDEVHELARRSAVAFAPYPGDAHYRIALPMRLFDYMAWGVPFVTSEFSALAELVEGTEPGVMVPPGDVDAYAEGLAAVLGDPSLARRLGENGRELVRTRLNWERESSRLVELYADLFRSREGPRS
jgi:glycosyltransferase involved in cell wall biosynthesis